MKKIVLLSAISLASLLYAYEPSVYGAGDIESENPYGLTQTEQAVLENKKTLQMLYNKLNEQQRKLEGLTTIIEGQNKEILSLKEQLEIKENTVQNNTDDNQTYSLLLEMGQMIDTINNTYVTQDQLKEALAGSRPQSSNTLGSPIGSNSADTYREGVQLFSNHSYGAAKTHFEQALSSNYKPAASNYYLGEVAYYTHDYENAIVHYKESSSLYDKSSYMAVLYLHTAISLSKTGKDEQANSFFEHVISEYPSTRSATIARNRMIK